MHIQDEFSFQYIYALFQIHAEGIVLWWKIVIELAEPVVGHLGQQIHFAYLFDKYRCYFRVMQSIKC